MKQILALILVISIFCGGDLSAQNEPYNSFQFNWGMGSLMRQDLSFSSMVHKDVSPVNILLGFNRSKKLEHQAYIKFGLYNPTIGEPYDFTSFYSGGEVNTAYPHDFILVDINYSLGKALVKNDNIKFSVGGRLRNRLHPSEFYTGSSSIFGRYFSFGVDAWLNAEYRLNEKHYLQSNIALPLFSYNSRSPYLLLNDESFIDFSSHKALKTMGEYIKRGKLQSWGNSQSLDFDLSYYYSLSEKWELGCSYWLSLNANQTPTRFASIENLFYLSGKLKF